MTAECRTQNPVGGKEMRARFHVSERLTRGLQYFETFPSHPRHGRRIGEATNPGKRDDATALPAFWCKWVSRSVVRHALRKPDGAVRGIATGDVFRRLVSKALAREWADKFDHAARFALQARAGTDAVAAHVRAALATRRGAVLNLREVAPELVPFVRLFYGSPPTYYRWDSAGRCRDVPQREALLAFGQHGALQQEAEGRHPDDSLVALNLGRPLRGHDAVPGYSCP